MEKIIANIEQILNELSKEKESLIIAIDGRCASGKTTLAANLQKIFDCNVIHMDEFFLRPEQRTLERLEMAGENVDHERFLEEVLLPLKAGKAFFYRPFNCKTWQLENPINIVPKKINIIEGTYSCHNNLYKNYDLKIFLTVDSEEQMRRIILRDGKEKAEIFKTKWIPMEEKYFSMFEIEKRCDYNFLTTTMPINIEF